MRILITGASGLIGRHLTRSLDELGKAHSVFDARTFELDVTDFQQCKNLSNMAKLDLIIHLAAYTNVDAAETNEKEVFRVNAEGTENIARVCAKLGIPMLYLSTDAVFDGTKDRPYTIWDTPNPKSVYGRSKLQGEYAVQRHTSKFYILRTNWVYGNGKKNFITNAIDACRKTEDPIVSFPTIAQIGSPTYVGDLVKAIENLISSERYSIYHYTNSGEASRTEVLGFIAKSFGKGSFTYEYKGSAPRPQYTVLEDNYFNAPNWKDSLTRFIKDAV